MEVEIPNSRSHIWSILSSIAVCMYSLVSRLSNHTYVCCTDRALLSNQYNMNAHRRASWEARSVYHCVALCSDRQ